MHKHKHPSAYAHQTQTKHEVANALYVLPQYEVQKLSLVPRNQISQAKNTNNY